MASWLGRQVSRRVERHDIHPSRGKNWTALLGHPLRMPRFRRADRDHFKSVFSTTGCNLISSLISNFEFERRFLRLFDIFGQTMIKSFLWCFWVNWWIENFVIWYFHVLRCRLIIIEISIHALLFFMLAWVVCWVNWLTM